MRRPSACTPCRARRRKCNIPRGQETCTYCTTRGLQCVKEPPYGGYYHQAQLSDSLPSLASPPSLPPSGSTQAMVDAHSGAFPALSLRIELVQLYFDYIHNQFHTLFHPPTFKAAVAEDRVPHVILYPMFALSARFSTDPFFCNTNPADRGAAFLEEGGKLLNIRHQSLTTVQACVLLGAACIADGDDVSENLYHSIACRMAQLLDLPNCPVSCPLDREINIRVWWSLCMVDVWSSTAVKLPKLMPIADIPLPMDEMHYLALRNNSSSSLVGSDGLDSLAPLVSEMIKLNRILLAINDFNETCVKEQPDGLLLEHAVHGLSRRLEDWVEALPESMRDTPENFAWFASRGLGRSFAAVYLGYYHFGQLLFYQFLHVGHYSSTPSASVYAEKCKDHSALLCEMIYRAFSTPNCDVLYTMVAHVLVIASTVQIHTLLYSEDESHIRIAHSRLEHNFKLLLRLKPYWSTLDRAMMRLRAFHDTCRKNMDTSFVLDRWMLIFLVEFAKPMEEKGVDEQSSPAVPPDTLDFVWNYQTPES